MSFLQLTPEGVKELRKSHPLLADAELPDTHTGATVRLSNGRALGYAGTCKQLPDLSIIAASPHFKRETPAGLLRVELAVPWSGNLSNPKHSHRESPTHHCFCLACWCMQSM